MMIDNLYGPLNFTVKPVMLDMFVAACEEEIQSQHLERRLGLDGPTYWFLHRYFVQASLTPGDFSFLNLYEDTELAGYQLHRLRTELHEALVDLSFRPGSFRVLIGWVGTVPTVETEDWQTVERAAVERTVHDLVDIINEAEQLGHSIFAIGD